MDIYTVKEGENISTIQATKLVIHMLRDLIFIYIYHPDLHINGKYIFSLILKLSTLFMYVK